MEFTARLMLAFASVLGLAMTVWGGYYFVTALMSWRRPMDYGQAPGPDPVCCFDRCPQ